MSTLRWQCASLQDLSAATLYAALKLRSEVFVLEQRCFSLDPDGLDLQAWQVLGFDLQTGALLACARLLPPWTKGEQQAAPMIGRVAVAASARGTGQGRALVRFALQQCEQRWPGEAIELSAQAHLQHFYASLGFVPISDIYDEDGIPHINMRCLPLPSRADSSAPDLANSRSIPDREQP
jgi:ElaA protein